ncbi:hypothetical protein Droror1_Dr00024336 [Drosera rotundifolia]
MMSKDSNEDQTQSRRRKWDDDIPIEDERTHNSRKEKISLNDVDGKQGFRRLRDVERSCRMRLSSSGVAQADEGKKKCLNSEL